MSVSAAIFIAQFNNGVIRRNRCFVVKASKFTLQILKLFHSEGYLFSYSILSDSNYLVYPNYKSLFFRLKMCSTPGRRVKFSHFQMRKFSNAGKIFVFRNQYGFQISNFSRISRISGEPVYLLQY